MANLRQRMSGLHQQRFITPLKRPSDHSVKSIVSPSPCPLQPLHPNTQIRLRYLHRQVKMVIHYHVRMHLPTKPHCCLRQRPFERLCGPSFFKQLPPVVTTVDHMIAGPHVLDSQQPRHPSIISRPQSFCQQSRYDPLIFTKGDLVAEI